MRALHPILAIGLTACTGADGAAPIDPLAACRASVEINCARAYECLDPPERELLGFPADPADCRAALEPACAEEPEEEFCADGETYAPDSAAACMAQLGGASCQQIFDESQETYAPACADMCRPAGA
ncbi:MAG TPA: hypothetical protein VFU21_29355 [Kofleriaceae bacterium]|nr:hypothetical protein [Kofleriaceae bacterium]